MSRSLCFSFFRTLFVIFSVWVLFSRWTYYFALKWMEFARWHAHSLNITYKIYLQIIEHRHDRSAVWCLLKTKTREVTKIVFFFLLCCFSVDRTCFVHGFAEKKEEKKWNCRETIAIRSLPERLWNESIKILSPSLYHDSHSTIVDKLNTRSF